MPLKNRILTVLAAAALGLGLGWSLGAQEAKKKDWKSQEEYDLAQAYGKAQGKAKIEALDKWKQAVPQSDFAEDREEMYLGAYQQLAMNRQAFDKAAEILKSRPDHFYSLSAIEQLIYTLNSPNPPQPADLDSAERVSRHLLTDLNAIFADSNKPETVAAAQWPQAKSAMNNLAQQTIAWIAVQRKDNPKAEVELAKFLQMDGTQARFSYFLAQALLAQNQQRPEKQVPALFHFARAAAYTGQNSLPAAERTNIQGFLTRAYTTYHGSNEGLDQLLALAGKNTFPPADFKILNTADIAEIKARQEAEERAKQGPMLTLWADIKKELTGENGPAYFEMSVKEASLPSGAGGVSKFKGKLIALTPASRPKELRLGIEKPDVADAILTFEEALPGTMEVGADLEFEGTAKAYTKDPFTVTFDVDPPQLNGWTGKNVSKGPAGGKDKSKGKAK